MDQKIFSVDLDGVVRDQIGAIIAAAHLKYAACLARSHFDHWDPQLGAVVGVPDSEFTEWAWTDPMVFASARPVKGARDKLLEVRERGYRIVVNTSTACPALTVPWLNWWRIPFDEVVHTTDKTVVPFSIHIDDSPKVLSVMTGRGLRVVRFALPWNRLWAGRAIPSISSWDQLFDVVKL